MNKCHICHKEINNVHTIGEKYYYIGNGLINIYFCPQCFKDIAGDEYVNIFDKAKAFHNKLVKEDAAKVKAILGVDNADERYGYNK